MGASCLLIWLSPQVGIHIWLSCALRDFFSWIEVLLRIVIGGALQWIPLEFMKDHGHQIGNEAVLQDEHGMTWEVSVSRGSWSGLRAGWKKFADNHTMAVGDKIEFTLIADSVFAVRIISETSQKPISHISRLCEDSHETVYKGISRKRSVRYVSSRSSNKMSHGSAFEDEAESHNHQFHAGIVLGTSSNSCKRARSKRCWNYKQYSKDGSQAGIK